MKEKKGENMERTKEFRTFKVDITVDKNGEIKYSNDYFEVEWGDHIIWKFRSKGHYAIHLGPKTPFEWKRQDKPGGDRYSIVGIVKDYAVQGEYKYFVAIYNGRNLLTEDPKFIVRRRTK